MAKKLTGNAAKLAAVLADAKSALGEAVEVFRATYANSLEGGACNFDSPEFRLRGMRISTVDKAAAAAGLSVYSTRSFGSVCFVLSDMPGMAIGRTRAAEAVAKAMKISAAENMPELEISVHYAID